MNITIEDVAKEAGVSITTVSRVMNSNYPVSQTTREKVNLAIKKLDFTPNVLARGLIQKKTNTIGVLIPSIENIYFTGVVSGIQNYLRDNGYQILLSDTSGSSNLEMENAKALKERLVDGIITIDPRTSNIKNGFYKKLNSEIPLVLINGYNEGVKLNFVLNDQKTATEEAFSYLYDLGHREIAFVRGPQSYSYDIKEESFKNFLENNNLTFYEENIITIEKGNSTQSVELTTEQIKKRFSINSIKAPTAFFCCNDFMAIGTLYAAQLLNLKVPEDISIIGYDNTIISQISMPKITSVDQNMHKIGESAAKLLNDIIKSQTNITSKLIIDTPLIIRESTGKVLKTEEDLK